MSDLKVKLILEMIDKLTSPVKRMSDRFLSATKRMDEATSRLNKKLQQMGKSVADIGTATSLRLTAPIAALGGMAVKTSAQFEKMKASLKTVMGSKIAADGAFKQIQDFSTTTPFGLEEVLSSFIKLKALGLDPSEEALKSYGNTSSAMGKSLDQMIEAVADATTGEFERLKEFGIKASQQGNKVAFVFQGKKTVVKKNAEEISKYLQSIGNVQFAGAMDEQMKTLSGSFSNLEDAVQTSLSSVGDNIVQKLDLKGFTVSLADAVSRLAKAFEALPQWLQGFIIKGALILALIGPLLFAVGQFIIMLGAMIFMLGKVIPVFVMAGKAIFSFGAMLLTTPIGWFILALAALSVAGFILYKNWDKVKAYFVNLWSDIKWAFKAGIEFIIDLFDPLFKAFEMLKKGFNVVGNFAVNNPLSRAVAGMGQNQTTATSASPSSAAVSPLVLPQNKVDAGGIINIKIDGPPGTSVAAKPNNSKMDFKVDNGFLLNGAY